MTHVGNENAVEVLMRFQIGELKTRLKVKWFLLLKKETFN